MATKIIFNEAMKKIAIIGSGISGAASVFFLRQTLGNSAEFTVFEKSSRVGGRMKNDQLGGGFIEQGGTIYHSSNRYIQEIMAQYGLISVVPHNGDGEGSQMGIWDGSEFRLHLPTHRFASAFRILLRYKRSLLRLEQLVKQTTRRWSKLYELQAEGRAFKTPDEFYKLLGLYELTQTNAYDYFTSNGVSDRALHEFVDCVSRVNYAQDGQLNALADLISLAGAGLDGGTLHSVGGGNDQLAKRILAKGDVSVRLNTEVVRIDVVGISAENNTYTVTDADGNQSGFDIVIIACPLDLTNLQIPYDIKRDRAYQELHATFVAGHVNAAYFGLRTAPNSIYTTESGNSPFLSLSRVSWSPEWKLPIYKLFSRKPIPDWRLADLFTEIGGTTRQSWRAYTKLAPMAEWPPFEIAPNLYYPSAMESSFSSIEGQAVAARNVANLIAHTL